MRTVVPKKQSLLRHPLTCLAGSLALNALAVVVLGIAMPEIRIEPDAPRTTTALGGILSPPMIDYADEKVPPMNETDSAAQPFPITNSLPADLFESFQPEPEKLNGFLDTQEGGTALRPDGVKSGGGGGENAESETFGHEASNDRVWSRKIWKTTANRLEADSDAVVSRPATTPGVLKNPGAGDGLGNGNGSGALGSQGSGTGSGAGVNGSNIGSGIGTAAPVAVSKKPSVVSTSRGIYPSSARSARHEGTVVLNVEVLPTGLVGTVSVKTSSGHDDLDQAAISAAKEWRFTGALKDGVPVAFWYSIPYQFVLTEQ